MTTELSIKTAEGRFLERKSRINDLIKKCDSLAIKDDASLIIATQCFTELKEEKSAIEKDRKTLKAPWIAGGDAIDELAKTFSVPMDASLEKGRAKGLAYNQEKRIKAEKKEARIKKIKDTISLYAKTAVNLFDNCKSEAELKKVRQDLVINFPGEEQWFEFTEEANIMKVTLNDYCILRRVAINTPAESDDVAVEEVKEAIVAQSAEIASVEVADASFKTTSKLKDEWKFEVIDKMQLPADFLSVNEVKINAFIRENKGSLVNGETKFGVKFFTEETFKI